MPYYTRITNLIAAMKNENYSDLFISNPTSIAYLTQYHNPHPGERLYVLHVKSDGTLILVLNKLFLAPQNLPVECHVHWYNDGEAILEQIASTLSENAIIGVDKDWPSRNLLEMMTFLPSAMFKNGSPLIDHLRAIKSSEEQSIMAEASRLNDLAMEYLISLIPQGLPEDQMVDLLAKKYQALGCDGFSFEPIIAYGPNGADPHHLTNDDTPKIGQSVILDIGSFYQGYASDMTRTVFYGQPSEKASAIYEVVKSANQAAIDAVKPGVSYASIDRAARKVIEDAGYGIYFTHRTGHGIGIEVHEPGDVGAFNPDLLEVGHVFSIEPGIYLTDELGVRIEDLVIVTEDGCKVLNTVSKNLTICEPI